MALYESTFRFSGSAGVCSIQCIRPRLDLAYEYCGMYTRTVEPDRTRAPLMREIAERESHLRRARISMHATGNNYRGNERPLSQQSCSRGGGGGGSAHVTATTCTLCKEQRTYYGGHMRTRQKHATCV
eukprot:scaffold86218_cov66-Phaeocystis_antarctica.AAC.4